MVHYVRVSVNVFVTLAIVTASMDHDKSLWSKNKGEREGGKGKLPW